MPSQSQRGLLAKTAPPVRVPRAVTEMLLQVARGVAPVQVALVALAHLVKALQVVHLIHRGRATTHLAAVVRLQTVALVVAV